MMRVTVNFVRKENQPNFDDHVEGALHRKCSTVQSRREE